MRVELKNITPNIEEFIVETARLSSSRKDKKEKPEGLINYLIKNHHWSPFEHGFLSFEIETSKAIAIQLLRHRSNFFQEFSQRYADVSKGFNGDMFESIELRQQAANNRQSSEEVFDPIISMSSYFGGYIAGSDNEASKLIEGYLEQTQEFYNKLLEAGAARETARFILPMCTKTKLVVTMNVRSLVHWLDLRDDSHAQKEIQLIAQEVKKIAIKELPIISKARGYEL